MTWYKKIEKLRTYCDPMMLCMVLANETNYGAECNHTFARTIDFVALESPQKNLVEFLALLRSLGAFCDCEVLFKISPIMEELVYDDYGLAWDNQHEEDYGFEEYLIENYDI